jgi:hypothetical protein
MIQAVCANGYIDSKNVVKDITRYKHISIDLLTKLRK